MMNNNETDYSKAKFCGSAKFKSEPFRVKGGLKDLIYRFSIRLLSSDIESLQ
jgi:hypothetical protein